MDMDELDEKPKQAAARIPRFAPKSFKPKQKPPDDAPKSEPSASNGAVKMEVEPKSEIAVNDEAPTLMDEEEPRDDEDKVVREIDVFFTPSIDANAQLYVLQYPLRPSWRPYDLEERCEEVRVKPVTAEVQMDLSLDVDSKNYDQDLGRKLKITNRTLSSSWIPPQVKGYTVGVLTGNKLYLNPVQAVVQLRPSLEYLDSDNSKRRTGGAESTNLKVTTEEKADEKPIPSKKQNNKQIESSIDQRSDCGQCWVPLKYHNSNSDISKRYMERMTFQENNHLSFTMSPDDYLKFLSPGASCGNAKHRGPSKSFLLSLSLEERLKKLLSEEPPVRRYSVLKHFAPDHSDEEFLRVLEKHAWLVQGLWAPKSALVIPSGDTLQLLGRDFALLLFSRNLKVGFSQLNVPRKLVPHVKEFLNVFGVERPSSRDWKFREEPDISFIAHNPDVVESQQLNFIQMEEKIYSIVQNKEGKGAPVKSSESKPKTGQSIIPERGFGVSANKVHAGRKTMSNETREALPKALHKLFQNHKVCSFQMICQGLRELAVSQSTLAKADARVFVAAANGADDPPEELRAVICQIAVDIHGYYVLKSSPEHPEYDQLRDVVITLLKGKGPNGKLQKSEIAVAVRTQLNREMANNEYNKVMNDFCTSKGSCWVLRTPDSGNLK